MRDLTPLLLELFKCEVAYATLVAPKLNLKRLVDRIVQASRLVFRTTNGSGMGVIGQIGLSQTDIKYLKFIASRTGQYKAFSVSTWIDTATQTPSQNALEAAKQTLRWSKDAEHQDFIDATRRLRQHFVLEALALI